MATHDFQRFLDTFFSTGAEAAKDGPDTAALSRLQGYEQDEAERMLLERLGLEDSRAAQGLGVLRSQRALPRILELLKSLEGKEKELEGGTIVPLSLAWYRIEGDPRAIENIVKVLETSTIDVFRLEAIHALRESGAPDAKEALMRTVENDEVPLMRHNAAKALLIMAGKIKDMRESPPVTIRLMIKAPNIREEAVREFKYLLNG